MFEETVKSKLRETYFISILYDCLADSAEIINLC